MLASTMIKRIQELIDMHGDVQVQVGHPTDTYPVRNKATGVDFIHAGSKSTRGDMFWEYSEWPNCIRIKCPLD